MKQFFSATLTCAVLAGGALAQDRPAPLPAMGADLGQSTVSGISSGGFMATQLATAYSSRIQGVGVVAAGPFYCAHTYAALGSIENATNTCMTPLEPAVAANGDISWKKAQAFARAGKIDAVGNLKRQRVYVFSGDRDDTVKTIVTDQVERYYLAAGTPKAQISYVRNAEAGHAFMTSNQSDQGCSVTGSPYINNCGFMQAHDLLRHLYPARTAAPNAGRPAGTLIQFDQKEFATDARTSMDDTAWVYVPDACTAGGCAVHIAFHGCRQGATAIGSRFYEHAGYNSMADTNRVIVLYPQVHVSKGIPSNPRGCWDFWGYTNGREAIDAFATRSAPQMAAIVAMLDRLGEQR